MTAKFEIKSDIYDLDDYKTYIQQKAVALQKPSYKKLLIEGSNHRKGLAEALASFGAQEKVDAFLDYYYETLKRQYQLNFPIIEIEPLLPLANLKRETIVCSTQTIFQNKLSEVLYEDTGMVVKKLNFASESEEFINELRNLEEKIFKEVRNFAFLLANFQASLCDKESLAKARWYGFELKYK